MFGIFNSGNFLKVRVKIFESVWIFKSNEEVKCVIK